MVRGDQLWRGTTCGVTGPVEPVTLVVRLLKRGCQFTRTCVALWHKQHFCTPAVRSCTAPGTRTPNRCQWLCTQPERLVARVHYVYDPENTHDSSLGHAEHSGTNGIFVHPLYGPVHLRDIGLHTCATQSGSSRSALYTRCTIAKTRMPVHQNMYSTVAQTPFLNTIYIPLN